MEKFKKILEVGIPNVCALLIVVAFLCLIFLLALKPVAVDASIKDVLVMLTGGLAGIVTMIFNYWYGSSLGSKAKSEALSDNKPVI